MVRLRVQADIGALGRSAAAGAQQLNLLRPGVILSLLILGKAVLRKTDVEGLHRIRRRGAVARFAEAARAIGVLDGAHGKV